MEENFFIYLDDFKKNYLNKKDIQLELFLVDLNSTFHFTLIKNLIMGNKLPLSEAETKQVLNVYKKFKIIITEKDISTKDFIMGYKNKQSIYLYTKKKAWKVIPNPILSIKENNIVIGFSVDEKGMESKFKTRPPLHKISVSVDKKNDIRSLARGAVCETKIREDLYLQVQELKNYIKKIEKSKVFLKSNISFNNDKAAKAEATETEFVETAESDNYFNKLLKSAIKHDKSNVKYPSPKILCNTLKLYLLTLEEISREKKENIKWIYLFDESLPSIQFN
jgi:hypothetical protein